jgi:hypothetical protein
LTNIEDDVDVRQTQVPAIQNGAWVAVTGQVKPGILGTRSRTFWASHIEWLPEP